MLISILKAEFHKIVTNKVLWFLFILMLAFNSFIIISQPLSYEAKRIGELSQTTGVKIDKSFKVLLAEEIEKNPYSELKGLYPVILDLEDPLDTYSVVAIGEAYIEAAGYKGNLADRMRSKYQQFQGSVDQKALSDESLSLYFAGHTYDSFVFLFRHVLGILTLECAILILLTVMSTFELERLSNMPALIASSRKGRKTYLIKGGMAIFAGLLGGVMITGISLALYFMINPYHDVMNSSVSSAFNYMSDFIVGRRPYVTWESLTVKMYLIRSLGIIAGLTLVFGLMAFVVSLVCDHLYFGILGIFITNGLVVALPFIMGSSYPAQRVSTFLMLTPMWLWLKRQIWFTDGDVDIIWPHFETLGLITMMILFTVLVFVSWQYFKRREMR